ncbi:hypothetical protein C8J57DRAFT_615255 [Mycena rebaudengoi]|nr:hypothetical protein C8J57DRAFT_615255 [Mycena rebaudengoi]
MGPGARARVVSPTRAGITACSAGPPPFSPNAAAVPPSPTPATPRRPITATSPRVVHMTPPATRMLVHPHRHSVQPVQVRGRLFPSYTSRARPPTHGVDSKPKHDCDNAHGAARDDNDPARACAAVGMGFVRREWGVEERWDVMVKVVVKAGTSSTSAGRSWRLPCVPPPPTSFVVDGSFNFGGPRRGALSILARCSLFRGG